MQIGLGTKAAKVIVKATSKLTNPLDPDIFHGQEDYRVTLVQCGLLNDPLKSDAKAIGKTISFESPLPLSSFQKHQYFFEITNGSSTTPIEVDLEATPI